MSRASSYEPSAWIAALRLDDLERYVLVSIVRPNTLRGTNHGAVNRPYCYQLLSLVRLMLWRATCLKSLGTRESAATAGKATPEVGVDQSIAVTRPGWRFTDMNVPL